MLDNQVSAKWTRVDWRNRCQALSPECAHSLGTHSIIQCTLTAKQSLSLQWIIKWVPRECRDSEHHTPVLTVAWCLLSKDCTFTWRSLDYPVCTDCKTVPFFVLDNRECQVNMCGLGKMGTKHSPQNAHIHLAFTWLSSAKKGTALQSIYNSKCC